MALMGGAMAFSLRRRPWQKVKFAKMQPIETRLGSPISSQYSSIKLHHNAKFCWSGKIDLTFEPVEQFYILLYLECSNIRERLKKNPA